MACPPAMVSVFAPFRRSPCQMRPLPRWLKPLEILGRNAIAAYLISRLVGNMPKVHVLGSDFQLFDVGGVVGTIGLGATLLMSVARNVRLLYRAEPLP